MKKGNLFIHNHYLQFSSCEASKKLLNQKKTTRDCNKAHVHYIFIRHGSGEQNFLIGGNW